MGDQTLLETCDVTKTWSPSWILPRIKNKIKTVGIGNFSCLTCKIIIMIIIIKSIEVSSNFSMVLLIGKTNNT